MDLNRNIQFVDLIQKENIEEFDRQLNSLKQKLGVNISVVQNVKYFIVLY